MTFNETLAIARQALSLWNELSPGVKSDIPGLERFSYNRNWTFGECCIQAYSASASLLFVEAHLVPEAHEVYTLACLLRKEQEREAASDL